MGSVFLSENTLGFVEAKPASLRQTPGKSGKPLGSPRRRALRRGEGFHQGEGKPLPGEQESQFCTLSGLPRRKGLHRGEPPIRLLVYPRVRRGEPL